MYYHSVIAVSFNILILRKAWSLRPSEGNLHEGFIYSCEAGYSQKIIKLCANYPPLVAIFLELKHRCNKEGRGERRLTQLEKEAIVAMPSASISFLFSAAALFCI